MRVALHALCGAAGAAWRESFPLGGRDVARWFPGHMAKGLKKMQSSLKLVDCIIEVHDARIPLSGRNPLFQETLGLKPHVLVLNKMDLADLKEQQKIIQHLEGEGLKNVVFTSCVKDENIKQVMPLVRGLVEGSYRYHRGENLEYCAMVIGIPNVGKSSLINALRRQHLGKGKATRVGGEPGITRAVMSRIQVCDWPLMFLLDTPGVLSPRIESVEMGLKLALCGTVLDHLVGEETLADYLLYTLNRHQLFGRSPDPTCHSWRPSAFCPILERPRNGVPRCGSLRSTRQLPDCSVSRRVSLLPGGCRTVFCGTDRCTPLFSPGSVWGAGSSLDVLCHVEDSVPRTLVSFTDFYQELSVTVTFCLLVHWSLFDLSCFLFCFAGFPSVCHQVPREGTEVSACGWSVCPCGSVCLLHALRSCAGRCRGQSVGPRVPLI
ncbi:mitochondrial ribosome-associated GTPase 1 isoform X2 [Enhydra lutris kenyoni]|uniref:Mitochondrial ribosome-associated GTPase 1 isoform X2 n=1 Tax=Enhydra lutris kenyoni TaxID=391180 RepID=A0A2Y9J369_ENHLU|nr:mitochondrial ribosome-associated GTPase 1 isoform X2 [Enhydra lutris kenyoni]